MPRAKRKEPAPWQVERVPVDSTPVRDYDFYHEGKWSVPEEVKGSIVRVRAVGGTGKITPAELQSALLEAGAIAAHVTVVPLQVALKARVEGLTACSSPRERMQVFIDEEETDEEIAREVWRIMEEEAV